MTKNDGGVKSFLEEKRMKKILKVFISTLFLFLSLVSCGNLNQPATNNPSNPGNPTNPTDGSGDEPYSEDGLDESNSIVLTIIPGYETEEFTTVTKRFPKEKEANLPAVPFTREGYSFIGWSYKEGTMIDFLTANDPVYCNKEKISLTENTTLYAVWLTESDATDDRICKIYFHSNNESDSTYIQYVYIAQAAWHRLIPNRFEREGYIFSGWSEDQIISEESNIKKNESSISNLSFYDGTSTLLDLHYYAQWTDASKLIIKYMRNYNKDDTESFTQEIDVVDNQATYRISGCPYEPESDDYVFRCWTGNMYEGETIEFNDSSTREIIYKAKWLKKEEYYKLTYHDNTQDDNTIIQYYDTSYGNRIVTIKECPFTSEEGTFAGWGTSNNAVKPSAQPYDRCSIEVGEPTFKDGNKGRHLYALWSKDITLTFNSNDGTNQTTTEVVQSYIPVKLSDSYFSREGKKLVCWSTSKDSKYTYKNGNYKFDEDNYFSTDTTLYAVWSDPIQVTFDSNGGEQENIIINCYGDTLIECPSLTRQGYELLGLSTKNTGIVEIELDNIRPSESITYYAVWSKPITIKVYSGQDDLSPEYFEVTFDTNKTYDNYPLYYAIKDNSVFNQWKESKELQNIMPDDYYIITFIDNSTEEYHRYKSEYVFTEEFKYITLKWDLPFIVTYHSNNGKEETSIEYNYNDFYAKSSTTFSYEGYTFKGWSKQSDSETYDYKAWDIVKINYDPDVGGSLDLYAIWEKDEE